MIRFPYAHWTISPQPAIGSFPHSNDEICDPSLIQLVLVGWYTGMKVIWGKGEHRVLGERGIFFLYLSINIQCPSAKLGGFYNKKKTHFNIHKQLSFIFIFLSLHKRLRLEGLIYSGAFFRKLKKVKIKSQEQENVVFDELLLKTCILLGVL